jgi:hypothetical protein
MAKESASKMRWSKFWWGDWQNDPTLRMCSFQARGVWMEMLAIMHAAEPVGHLLVNKRAPSMKQLASLAGGPEKEVISAIKELEDAGVFSRTEDGTIYSRRMVRDKVASDRGRETGSTGGNPSLKAEDAEPVKGSGGGGGITPPVQTPLKLEAEAEEEREKDSKPREARMPSLSDSEHVWEAFTGKAEIDDDAKRKAVYGPVYIRGAFEDVCKAARINEVQFRGDCRPLMAWLDDKIPFTEIVAAVARVASRHGYTPPTHSLAYFDRAVRDTS